jgi:hypothetical protein
LVEQIIWKIALKFLPITESSDSEICHLPCFVVSSTCAASMASSKMEKLDSAVGLFQ